MSRQTFDDFDTFLAAIQQAGIDHIVQRVVHEIRPRPGRGTEVIVEEVHRAEFLGYRRGVVYRCEVDGARREACEQKLDARGIAVKSVSGNIT